MLQSLKRFWLVAVLLAFCSQSAWAFVYLGPGNVQGAPASLVPFFEAFQAPAIGYDLPGAATGVGNQNGSADIGAPKNYQQGYRWNVPLVYYAFDTSFADYFGTTGMGEVDKAFAFFNSLKNVSSYSSKLTEFPFTSSRLNFAAQALGLIDVKSTTMGIIIEQLGLMQPERFVWCLHDRDTTGLTCPNFIYLVIQRNFDPVTKTYSPFVNNVLYGFEIVDFCPINPNPVAPLIADAIEYSVDPRTVLNLAVASQFTIEGSFYTGLTRDDIGGLRALYSATNVMAESTGTNIDQAITNNFPQLLVTQDYSNFLAQASINNAATLVALFPGLVITSTTNFFTNVVTTNTVAVLVPVPFGPAGSFNTTFVSTFTTNVQQRFIHTFANIKFFPGHLYTNAFISTQSTSVTQKPFAPVGTLQTNVITSTTLVPGITNGDFYILSNSLCGDYFNVTTQLITITTNITTLVVNTNGVTNVVAPVASILTYFTNYTYQVFAVNCVSNTADLRRGVEKITFIRQDFDSILGTTWTPETNFYHQTAVTNFGSVLQTFRRVITQPDIVFTAADLTAGPGALPTINELSRTQPNFNITQVPAGQPGPGTVQPRINFTFNDVGPIFENLNGGVFIGTLQGFAPAITPDTNTTLIFRWGTYDGSTNPPIIYPSSASLANLEASIYFQIINPSPITYSLSALPFSVTLLSTNGTAPITWPTNSLTLPPGLHLSTSGVLSGTLSNVNSTNLSSTLPFVFNVQAKDAQGRVTSAAITLLVAP